MLPRCVCGYADFFDLVVEVVGFHKFRAVGQLGGTLRGREFG